jgi:hypothetical protein
MMQYWLKGRDIRVLLKYQIMIQVSSYENFAGLSLDMKCFCKRAQIGNVRKIGPVSTVWGRAIPVRGQESASLSAGLPGKKLMRNEVTERSW